MKKRASLLALGGTVTLVSLLFAFPPMFSTAFAQTANAATATTTKAPERALTYALIAAVGDRFTFVTQKQSVGSNVIDNFTRRIVKIEGNVLNNAVLRGLDQALAQSEPTSVRVFMTLEAAEMENVLPQDRESIAIGKIITAVEKMPQRKDWDKIIVVTPKYMQSEYSGMGSKLSGLGVYIQPLYSARLDGSGTDSTNDLEVTDSTGSDTRAPDGSRTKSKRYIAPFSYIQKWVLDAKTLKVLEKDARHDFSKLFDKQSTAVNVAQSIPDDVLAERILTLAERSAASSMGADLSAVVLIGDVTAIDAKTGEPLKAPPPKK
jgi:hypothetical protein